MTRFFRWAWGHWQAIHDENLAPAPAAGAGEPERKKGRRGAAALGGPAAAARRHLDWRPLVVLLVVAVSLTLQEYWGERAFFARLFPPPASIHESTWAKYWELASFAWWSGWRLFGYLILPMIVIALIPGERIRDYGLATKGFRRHIWIYVVLFLGVLPLVIAVSFTRPFQRTYPFYKLANRSTFDLVAWEVMYAIQFLSLEFFFRGFMLHGLKRAIGAHAIWVMIVPYCMIHYGKPMPETLGAIVAGLILGTLALRTRSIWAGVLIHISVAVTMDLLSLTHCPAVGPCLRH